MKHRRIVVWDEDRQEDRLCHNPTARSLHNRPSLSRAVADGNFFKSLKQVMKIKTFVGTNEKAVLTQIWTAPSAMLLLRWLRLKARFN
jgi:hypothetical protein